MNTTEKYIEKLEKYNKYLLRGSLNPIAVDKFISELSQLKSTIEQEEKEQRVTAEEILMKHFPLLPKSSNREGIELIIKAMIDFRNSGRAEVCPECGSKDVKPYKDHLCCYECGEFFNKNRYSGRDWEKIEKEFYEWYGTDPNTHTPRSRIFNWFKNNL